MAQSVEPKVADLANVYYYQDYGIEDYGIGSIPRQDSGERSWVLSSSENGGFCSKRRRDRTLGSQAGSCRGQSR